jgi:hypothetical protein
MAIGSSGAGASGGHRLHFVERGGGVRFIDSAPPNAKQPFDFSPGDLAIVTRRLDRPDGRHAGMLRIACVAIDAKTQQCTGTASLPGGTLEFGGLSRPAPMTRTAITGGTGAYDGASGMAIAQDRAGPNDVADLTIEMNAP